MKLTPDDTEGQSLGCGVEAEGFTVGFDGIAPLFPCRQAAAEELDLHEIQRESAPGHLAAGFVAGAGAVDEEIPIFGDADRDLLDFFRRDAPCAGDHLGLGEQVERLADVKEQNVRL